MTGVYLLGVAFTIWMGVEAVRRGQAYPWLFLILLFPPIGAVIYFFANYVGSSFSGLTLPRRVSAADLRHAEAEVRRLDNASAWVNYSSLLRERGDHPNALNAAKKAIEREPSSIDALYELGRGLLETGQVKEAAETLQAVVSKDRTLDSHNALFLLAKAREASGDRMAARADLEELTGRSSQPKFLYELAGMQARAGDNSAAEKSLRRIVDEAEYVPRFMQRTVRPWVRRARKGLDQLQRGAGSTGSI